MVTLAEMAPAMVRKNAGKYMEQLVPLILQFMADLEEEEGWAEADEILDEDNDCYNVVAEAALDRLACGLGKSFTCQMCLLYAIYWFIFGFIWYSVGICVYYN